jgi:hypothetical protein
MLSVADQRVGNHGAAMQALCLTLSLPNGLIKEDPRFYVGVEFHHMFI